MSGVDIEARSSRTNFESWIAPDLERIGATADAALAQGGPRPQRHRPRVPHRRHLLRARGARACSTALRPQNDRHAANSFSRSPRDWRSSRAPPTWKGGPHEHHRRQRLLQIREPCRPRSASRATPRRGTRTCASGAPSCSPRKASTARSRECLKSLAAMMAFIRAMPAFADLDSKESHADGMPFQRMKVRLKKEIVTMGVPGIDPSKFRGHLCGARELERADRGPGRAGDRHPQQLRSGGGQLQGAIDPGTRSFGEFPPSSNRALSGQQHRKIAMFCTGGIRCEKATSFCAPRASTMSITSRAAS